MDRGWLFCRLGAFGLPDVRTPAGRLGDTWDGHLSHLPIRWVRVPGDYELTCLPRRCKKRGRARDPVCMGLRPAVSCGLGGIGLGQCVRLARHCPSWSDCVENSASFSLSGNKYCCLGRAVAILILTACSAFYFWAKLKAQPLITQPLRDTAGEASTSINTVPQR